MPKIIAWDGTSVSLSFVLHRYRISKTQQFQNAILLGAPLACITKMDKFLFTAFLCSCSFLTFSQNAYFGVKLINQLGRPVDIILTHYDLDSIPQTHRLTMTDEKWVRSPYFYQGVRLDIIALIGNDTVFSKSVEHNNNQDVAVRLTSGHFSVEKPLKPHYRLQVSGSNNTGQILRKGDYRVIKLHSKGKVRGYVHSFTKNQLTIETKKGKLVVIEKDDLKAFRSRESVWASGIWFVLFPYYAFKEIKDIEFKYVEWTGELGHGKWVEIK